MSKSVDYYISLRSPWVYLGSARLEEMAARHGATIAVKPVDFGKVFSRTGGLPLPKRAPERQAYRLVELQRWRAHLDIPLNLHPAHFAVDESLAARTVMAAEASKRVALAHAILRAVWTEERDISDPATLKAIAADCGLEAEALLARAEEAELQAAYEAQTEEAVARGVFGAPTYVYRDELFWGQDRLAFLDRALAAA